MNKNHGLTQSLANWFIAILFTAVLGFFTVWWMDIVKNQFFWALLIFIFVPIIQFLITPLFQLIGVYRYHSPMVISMANIGKVIDLHNGTSYDYLIKMRGVKPGKAWQKTMLKYYMEALLDVISNIENEELSDQVVVRGSSYFLSDRTIKKFGFISKRTSIPEKINILFNYLDLFWMYSCSEGKMAFPNLANIKTAKIKGADLVEKKALIQSIYRRLK